ncbi:tetratricopeptide repeat protein 24, partial [Passerculus sandwichensis]
TGPTTPAAPSSCKKSQKKKKKAAEARAAAQEGGDEAAGRVAAIEGLTRAGHRALAVGAAREAVGCFRKALLLSRDTASPQLHRACAFNLGAAYVETGKPKKGFEFLLQSQPSEAESGDYSGSLYFSVGAAHEGLQDFPKALECFEQVPGHAGAAQAGSRAGTCVQMGCCYLGMREPARAARCFLDAAQAYAAAESPGAAAVALSRASGSMLQSRRFRAADIAGVLARCRSLCESIPDPALRGNAAPSPLRALRGSSHACFPSLPSGKLYSDIGLGYSQLHIFSLAAESFERALGLCGGERDRQREAALLQNLGAALNALRSFGTALGWHRRAAALHGALGNRRAQGQSFGNLAFACSQLGKHGDAAESYLHALQAFRDSGDLQGQWQACEGLGAACLHLGDPQKAVGHYQEALVLLSRCQDSPRAAHKRVVHKLTDAIQHRLHLSHLSYPNPGLEPSHLRFCSTLPRASGTQLQGSKVGKAQAEDELYWCTPGAHPRYSGTRVALTGGLTLEPCNPSGLLGTSGEDDDGPSSAPGYHSEPQANSTRTTSPLPPAKLPRASLQLRKYHRPPEHQSCSEPRPEGLTLHPTGHQNHQTLHRRPPERRDNDPAAGCRSRRGPRTATRTLSLVCSLV